MFKKIIFILCNMLFFCNANIGRSSDMIKTLLSGSFSNDEDLETAKRYGINMSALTFSIRPFVVPDLSNEVSLLLEQRSDNQLIRQEIQVFTDDGALAYVQPYTLVNSEKFIPGTYSTSDIESLTQKDVKADPKCGFIYERIGEKSFNALIPDCSEQGQAVTAYFLTVTCKGYETINHENHPELNSNLPYHINKVKNFPIPQIPTYDILKDLCDY